MSSESIYTNAVGGHRSLVGLFQYHFVHTPFVPVNVSSQLRRKFGPAQKRSKTRIQLSLQRHIKGNNLLKTNPWETNFLRKAVIRNLTNGSFLQKKKHRRMHWILYPKIVIIFMLCASGVTGKRGLFENKVTWLIEIADIARSFFCSAPTTFN